MQKLEDTKSRSRTYYTRVKFEYMLDPNLCTCRAFDSFVLRRTEYVFFSSTHYVLVWHKCTLSVDNSTTCAETTRTLRGYLFIYLFCRFNLLSLCALNKNKRRRRQHFLSAQEGLNRTKKAPQSSVLTIKFDRSGAEICWKCSKPFFFFFFGWMHSNRWCR